MSTVRLHGDVQPTIGGSAVYIGESLNGYVVADNRWEAQPESPQKAKGPNEPAGIYRPKIIKAGVEKHAVLSTLGRRAARPDSHVQHRKPQVHLQNLTLHLDGADQDPDLVG